MERWKSYIAELDAQLIVHMLVALTILCDPTCDLMTVGNNSLLGDVGNVGNNVPKSKRHAKNSVEDTAGRIRERLPVL